MKTAILKLLILLLILTTAPTFAFQLLIEGRPAILIPSVSYYTLPMNYSRPSQDYLFVKIGGESRVCFIESRPELVLLDLLRVRIKTRDDRIFLWYCYRFDPRFFQIDF